MFNWSWMSNRFCVELGQFILVRFDSLQFRFHIIFLFHAVRFNHAPITQPSFLVKNVLSRLLSMWLYQTLCK